MIKYRRPLPNEAETFAELHVQCWREAYVDILPSALMQSLDVGKRLPMWVKNLSDNSRIIFGAYDEGAAVGFIIAGKPVEELFDDMDGHIAAIYIAASQYRRGIGQALMSKVAGAWAEQGGDSLALGVLAENARARAFYESLGGKLIKTGTYEWDGFPLADAIYSFDDLPALLSKD